MDEVDRLADVLRSLQDLHLNRAGTLDNATLAREVVSLRADMNRLLVEVAKLRIAMSTVRKQADLLDPDAQ